jgi:hypothetical protein
MRYPREQVTKWHASGIQGSTIHATLMRNHAYTGSYSSVHRFLSRLVSLQQPDVPLRLVFKPAEAVQVDFGSGSLITDVYTGEIFKTWFFVMTLCWSRQQYAEFVRDQTVVTWLGCHRRAFECSQLHSRQCQMRHHQKSLHSRTTVQQRMRNVRHVLNVVCI